MNRTVLVVSHEASRTGAPKVAEHLLGALGSGGWRTVLVHRWGGPMQAQLDAAAERSFLEPAARARVTLRRWSWSKPLSRAVERWSVRRTLRRERPDLVWCNTVITSAYAVAAIRLGIPVVVHSHESQELVSMALDRTGLREVDASTSLLHLVGCATDTAEALAIEMGVPADAVRVLHSPVDVRALRDAAATAPTPYGTDDRPVVVACGVGDERKGVHTFGAAAALATAGARWVWVGRVPEDQRVAGVEYPGEQPSATAWIAHADVVALPSRADPFPLVVLEAMALDRPVVASDIRGPREQLGDAGTFVPVGDAPALARAVDGLISDRPGAERVGALGARRCEERWDVVPFGATARDIAGVASS